MDHYFDILKFVLGSKSWQKTEEMHYSFLSIMMFYFVSFP